MLGTLRRVPTMYDSAEGAFLTHNVSVCVLSPYLPLHANATTRRGLSGDEAARPEEFHVMNSFPENNGLSSERDDAHSEHIDRLWHV
jgi:hypothetical protein